MTTERNIEIDAWNPTASDCLPGGIDVDIDVSIGDETLSGEVTLCRDTINGGWVAYGDCADTWVSPDFLRKLCERIPDRDEQRALLQRLAAAAVAQVTDEAEEAADAEAQS